ncbi:THAP domain-containing protein 3-like isoform X1 [Trichoplusia ni]|uniref:THAP domain-containing protein 3-like isoform X1 n=1 Tax=Trichoplusia ni TaxID=7111 RepID=A0A7E5WWZ2_TRINI|nr:THAP domain-containing protein 3-like isoform X1 [Trichoplusia ni]
MPSCAVKWCGKHSKTSSYKKDGITFHRFPKIPELKEKWMNKINRENWFPTKYSAVCSRHFTPDCFEYLKQRRRLFSSAIPTMFLPILASPYSLTESNTNVPGPSHHNTGQSLSSKTEVHSEVNTIIEDQTLVPCGLLDDSHILRPSHVYDSPSSTMNTKVIVDPEIGELSPRKRKMKRQIDHLIYSLNNKKKHVKRLQDKNRVLVKKMRI